MNLAAVPLTELWLEVSRRFDCALLSGVIDLGDNKEERTTYFSGGSHAIGLAMMTADRIYEAFSSDQESEAG